MKGDTMKSKATIVMPEYELRKYLSDFGLKLIKDFMKTRHEEVKMLVTAAQEINIEKPTIH